MVLIVACLLLFQAIILYLGARSWLFPPATCAIYWAGVLLFSILIPFGDYYLSADAVMVFFLGSILFSIGGFISIRCIKQSKRPDIHPLRKESIQNFIVFYNLFLLSLIPFFFQALQAASTDLGIVEFATGVRFALGADDRTGIPRFFASLTSIGGILAYCAAWLHDGTRRDRLILSLAVLSPLSMNILTFSRTPIYLLLSGVISILIFRRTIRLWTVPVAVASGLFLMVLIGTVLGKGPDFHAGKSPFYAFTEGIAIYIVGGPLGFSTVLKDPGMVGEPGLSLRFFAQVAASLGAEIDLPSHVLGYVSGVLGNVYTIYFAYWLDGGWYGVILMATLAGFFCTALYLLARQGNPYGGVGMGIATGAILNSATGDWIFLTAMPWILMVLLVSILWNLPIIVFREKRPQWVKIPSG